MIRLSKFQARKTEFRSLRLLSDEAGNANCTHTLMYNVERREELVCDEGQLSPEQDL